MLTTTHNKGVSDRVCMRARSSNVLLPGNDDQTSIARTRGDDVFSREAATL